MPEFMKLAIVACKVSVIMVVLATGMLTTFRDATSLLREPKTLLASIVARNVLMPAIALVLIAIFPMHPAVKTAIMLLSVTPLPPLLPAALEKAGGRKDYCLSLLFFHGLLSIILVPLSLVVLDKVTGGNAAFSPVAVANTVGQTIILPLLLGIAIRRLAGDSVEKAANAIGQVGKIVLLIASLPFLAVIWPALQKLAYNGMILAMVLFIVGGLVIGQLLGGRRDGDKSALAIATASRHPGLAIAIAAENFAEQKVLVVGAVGIYTVLRMIVVPLYERWRKSSDKAVAAVA
jgi:bile acid:Na+ symporter, BASS family